MTRIKVIIEYEGTRYHGFQRQPGQTTVEATVEDAIRRLTGEETRLCGAGRTDAGVHARGQVIAFHTSTRIPPERIALALNTVLPHDIRALESQATHPSFHPRYDARAKWYRYLIYRQKTGYTFYRNLAYVLTRPLDLVAMQGATTALQGTHEYRSFCASGSGVQNFVRTVHCWRISERPPLLIFDVQANGFLYHMVRIMIGTLLEVGRGRMASDDIPKVLAARDRCRAGPTAPARGLYLMKVFY